MIRGHAVNEYNNFLDLGIRLNSTGDMMATPLLYRHRLGDHDETDWWLGGQLVTVSLLQAGDDTASDALIKALGLDEGRAALIGPNALYDSRDSVNNPRTGHRFIVRASLWQQFTPDTDDPHFASTEVEYSTYLTADDSGGPLAGSTLALNTKWRSTYDAPLLYQATLANWRGYTVGEQYAENLILAQAEARVPAPFWNRMGFRVFGGSAALFNDFDEEWQAYPMAGAGMHFFLQPEEEVIMRVEYALGKGEAHGFYIAIGQAFQ